MYLKSESPIGRRRLLQAGGSALVISTVTPALQACSSGEPAQRREESDGQLAMPSYVPQNVVDPDLPADDNDTPAAYLAYPANPQRLFDSPPAKSGAISVLKQGDTGQPPDVGRNPFWQELNRRVGAELSITQLVGADYASKLTTTIAGGDLPDLVQMPYNWPRLPDLLQATFTDLAPWLAGDGVKKWPNLAAIPTIGWKSVTINGGLWGIPWTFGTTAGSENRIRQDIFDEIGVTNSPSNGDDFLSLCAELTDPKRNRWALGDLQTTTVALVTEMVGAPNSWKEEGGKFTRDFESDEYKRMLEIVDQIRRKGYVYPDAKSNLAQGQVLFMGGRVAILRQAWSNWRILAARATDPKFVQGGLLLPQWDGGGQAAHLTSSGVFTFTALKKASNARIEELLNVLNWFAAPFGSEERLFTRYCIPERDYTLRGTDPVPTSVGTQECQNMLLTYLANLPEGIYTPGLPDQARTQHAYLQKLMAKRTPLPTVGLFSDSQLTTGQTIDKQIMDLRNDVIFGRKKVSDWDEGVATWRRRGGDKIRAEYERSFESNK